MIFNLLLSIAGFFFNLNDFGFLHGILISIFVLTGACIGDIIRMSCSPDMIMYSGVGEAVKLKFFWSYGIRITGAIFAPMVIAILHEAISIWLFVPLMIIVTLGSCFLCYTMHENGEDL
jgi:hypothetical protein